MIACPHEGIITLDCKITKKILILRYVKRKFLKFVIFVTYNDIYDILFTCFILNNNRVI